MSIDAPFEISESDLASFSKRVGKEIEPGHSNRTWWVVENGNYTGWQQSITSILHVLNTQGPFYGVLGYSQGATIVSLLLGILNRSPKEFEKLDQQLDLAILVAGFASRDPDHSMYYNKDIKAKTPTLVLAGETDEMVSVDLSLKMSEYFQNPQIYRFVRKALIKRHAGGHMIPMDSESRRVIKEFVTKEYPKI